MDEIAERQLRRDLFLERLYDVTSGRLDTIVDMYVAVGDALGFTREESDQVAQYLAAGGLLKFRASGGQVSITHPGIVKVEEDLKRRKERRSMVLSKSKKVFVVHGRNKVARDAMFIFLRAIGLQPLEWSQAAALTKKPSPYTGEILDAAFEEAQAILVLMTGDDEARLREPYIEPQDPRHETELTPQARPNVLFEAGMAMGRLPERTVLVELGDLRPFSDIGGRHVIRLINTTQRRQELAQRLQSAGCDVELSGTDWHTAGNFVAEAPNQKPEENGGVTSKQFPISIGEDTDNTISAKQATEILALSVGDDRIMGIENLLVHLSSDLSGYDVSQILGSLVGHRRVEAIRILAPKIRKQLSPRDIELIRGVLVGTERDMVDKILLGRRSDCA